uniref:Uncharacterized protein n=1 Tax=Solanum lycopersicum TaxID=4081 RepID=A0A3Q7HK04_SOLLC
MVRSVFKSFLNLPKSISILTPSVYRPNSISISSSYSTPRISKRIGSFFSAPVGEQFQEFGSLFSAKYSTNGYLLPPNFINVVGCLYGIGDMESLCEPGKKGNSTLLQIRS